MRLCQVSIIEQKKKKRREGERKVIVEKSMIREESDPF